MNSRGTTKNSVARKAACNTAAGRHALAVLGVFINRGSEIDRFSISAYGGDRAGLETPARKVPLNRVEILLKTGKKALEEREE